VSVNVESCVYIHTYQFTQGGNGEEYYKDMCLKYSMVCHSSPAVLVAAEQKESLSRCGACRGEVGALLSMLALLFFLLSGEGKGLGLGNEMRCSDGCFLFLVLWLDIHSVLGLAIGAKVYTCYVLTVR